MFGIGPMEFLVIAVFAVIFIGPTRLPAAMKQAGRFVVRARQYTSEARGHINSVMQEAENEIRQEEFRKLNASLADGDQNQYQHDNHSEDDDHEHYHDDHDDHDHYDHHHHDDDGDHHQEPADDGEQAEQGVLKAVSGLSRSAT